MISYPLLPPQSPWLPFKPNTTLFVYLCHNICHSSPCFGLGLYSWSNRRLANEVIRSETPVTPQAEGQGGIRRCLLDDKYKPALFLFLLLLACMVKDLMDSSLAGWINSFPPSALLILLQMHLARVFEAKSKEPCKSYQCRLRASESSYSYIRIRRHKGSRTLPDGPRPPKSRKRYMFTTASRMPSAYPEAARSDKGSSLPKPKLIYSVMHPAQLYQQLKNQRVSKQ